MTPVITHSWNLTENEAFTLQRSLASQVITHNQFSDIKIIAGVDVAYDKNNDNLKATVAVLDVDTLKIIDTAIAEDKARFPYIPGLFSFREIPSLVAALALLQTTPDLIVCDGQGIAHPRRFGLACHLGIMFDIPTIGCGKTRLIGEYSEPGPKRGDLSPLSENQEVVGAVLRTQDNIKPVFVSIGHRISLDSACDWILRLTPQYRLPETTRAADHLGRKK